MTDFRLHWTVRTPDHCDWCPQTFCDQDDIYQCGHDVLCEKCMEALIKDFANEIEGALEFPVHMEKAA